jgi:MATE family multidrug resistance protein
MSLVLAALWPLVPHALGWVGATQAVRPHAQCYIQIRLYAAPLMLCSFVLTSYLRGLGTMWIPMAVSMSANVVNAALAVVLVFGHLGLPRLGVAGAAWASTVAASVECAIYLGVFLLAARSRALGSRSVRAPSAPELRRFAALGLPIGLAWLFEMVAWTSFSVYAGTRSPVELAAHMVLFQVTGFCFMPAVAIGVAASTLVGHYLGARRPDLAWRSAGRALGLGVSYMTVVGSALVALRHPLLVAFNPDAAVVALGTSLAVVAGLYQPFDGFGIVTQGILRGAGRTAVPTYVMLGSGLLVFIPLVWVLGERAGLGVRGAWLAALAHVVVVSAVLGTVVARGRWRAARPAGVLETPLPVAR